MRLPPRLQAWLQDWLRFPWAGTARTLLARFREDRLGLTASSLTFTTTIALVPMLTVALAIFTAFPMFAKLQVVLQKWLIESLIPDNIARQVLGYLTQFSGKASKLGVVGLVALLVTALALVFTIDRTLNNIWRVRRPRPLGQRVLVYWAAITLGPLLLALSVSLTSSALAASRGLVVEVIPGGVSFLLDVLQFVMVAGGMAALYRYMPNTYVRWGHAWVGGVLVAASMELAKRLLAVYLTAVPTYSVVYGAFATVPILLVWIYMAWLIVLLGAVITAYLPSLMAGVVRTASAHGWQFQLALEVVRQLHIARQSPEHGATAEQLAAALHVDLLQLEPVLESLTRLDWVAPLNEAARAVGARFVLLADPEATPMEPLMAELLLDRIPATEAFWRQTGWAQLRLQQVL